MTTLMTTALPGVELLNRGKVRDVYSVWDNRLLFVATDRISAFDCVLPDGIPDKGRVLTQMSLFWFDFLKDIVPNHLVTADVNRYPHHINPFRDYLEGRSMLVKRAEMIQVECVARGYVAGSGWKDYQRTGAICGIPLPAGLQDGDALPQPIFTPATKSPVGHDDNIPFSVVEELAGPDIAARLRELTLALYAKASAYALTRGIIIADTKFEFGFYGDQLILADEVLTPDSSRFWPAGDRTRSFDKQFVRDYLETTGWDKQPPAPALPAEVIQQTSARYKEAYTILTGREL